MAGIATVSLALRLFADDLDPSRVSQEIGLQPSSIARKGDIRPSGFIEKTGRWIYRPERRSPGDLDAQLNALLDLLPREPGFWAGMHRRFRCDLFCGLWMQGGNEGLTLAPQTMERLGVCGLELHLDIYAPLPDEQITD